MTRRVMVLAVLLLAAAGLRAQVETIDPPPRPPLLSLPMVLGDWQGSPGLPLERGVEEILRADDYVNRIYRTDTAIAGVYVGYHRSQTQGASIHSPLNCLPGAGWQPVTTERRPLGTRGTVRQVVIQKGEERQLVLYWYQTVRRVEGNEYWSKLHLITDAVTSRRSDAALVRIVVPIERHRADGAAAAAATAYQLAEHVEPQVHAILFADPGKEQSL